MATSNQDPIVSETIAPLLYDKRLTERFLRKRLLTPAQLTAHLEALPDVGEKAVYVKMQALENNLGHTQRGVESETKVSAEHE